ncbi:MAG TPA: RNA-binding protein [Rhizomicrobium sp.]|nr:RNA-binding protein [Rhizomicrobium sp.]
MILAARKTDADEARRERHIAGASRSRERLDDGASRSRERRCIVTGEIMPDNRLIRFVLAPDGKIVPDVAAKLPGRGLWVTANRTAIAEAVEKKLFSRAAKAQAGATADLAARTEKALVARMLGDLGLARRAGSLVLGFDNVLRALESAKPPRLLIDASDGAADGKRKLYNAAHARGVKPALVTCLTNAELGLALGRENVIHAAVQPGGLAERLMFDAERLEGFRARSGNERDS